MKRLILPACVAVLCHLLIFFFPVVSSPAPPSSAAKGSTIHLSLSTASVQSVATPTPKKKSPPEKKPPKKKKAPKKSPPKKKIQKKPSPKPKKVVPRPIPKKRVVKTLKKVATPLDEPKTAPPEVAEPLKPLVEEAAPQEALSPATESVVESLTEEVLESASAPASGGVQSSQTPVSTYAPEPRYPKAAIRRGYEGVVILDVLVNGNGHVEAVKVKVSSGYSVLDRSAMRGVRRWHFSSTGSKGSVWMTQPVRFELKGV